MAARKGSKQGTSASKSRGARDSGANAAAVEAAQSIADKPGHQGPDPEAARQGAIHRLGDIAERLNALAAVRVATVGDSADECATLIRSAAQLTARARIALQREARGGSDG